MGKCNYYILKTIPYEKIILVSWQDMPAQVRPPKIERVDIDLDKVHYPNDTWEYMLWEDAARVAVEQIRSKSAPFMVQITNIQLITGENNS